MKGGIDRRGDRIAQRGEENEASYVRWRRESSVCAIIYAGLAYAIKVWERILDRAAKLIYCL